MTDDQIYSLVERFVVASEKMAVALEGLNETYRRQYQKHYPERIQAREAVVTRVPTEEDRIREAQGATGERLDKWLSEVDDEEAESEHVGTREREWLDANPSKRTPRRAP